jgi:cytochrome c-type biogenesis protein
VAVVLAVATQATATANPIQALGVFGAFAAGATSALLALSLSIALAKSLIARAMRRLAPAMNTIAAVMLIASGAYLVLYWLPTLLGDNNARTGGPITQTIEGSASTVANFLAAHTGPFAIGLAITLTVAAGLALAQRRARSADT